MSGHDRFMTVEDVALAWRILKGVHACLRRAMDARKRAYGSSWLRCRIVDVKQVTPNSQMLAYARINRLRDGARIVFAGRYAKVSEANGGTIVTGSLECHAEQCGRKYIPRDRA
jgi:hypothetical protein